MYPALQWVIWSKKRYGKEGDKPALPPWPGNDEIVKQCYVSDDRPYDEDQKQQALFLIAEESSARRKIIVDDVLQDPHPFIVRTEKSLAASKADERQLLAAPARKCLDIRVTHGSLDRALRIADALLKAMKSRAIGVELVDDAAMSTRITVLGENFGIAIDEQVERREEILSPNEKLEREKHPWMYPKHEYTYHPTGRLALHLKNAPMYFGRNTWADGKQQRLENMLNSFMCGLYKAAITERSQRLQQALDDATRIENQRRAQALRAQQETERTRLDQLNNHVDAWQRSQVIRAYANAVEEYAKQYTFTYGDLDGLEWVKWAHAQADRLDPLRESPYSALDDAVTGW